MTIGFATGYGLPWWLHYRSRKEDGETKIASHVMLLPLAAPQELGLSLVGAL